VSRGLLGVTVKAGIIAAGEGSRLRAAGITVPKPLVEVAGISLLERTLRALVDNGAEEIALITNTAEVADRARAMDLPVAVRTVIKVTESSMHSLYELGAFLAGERFVLCTIDSIILPDEFAGFVERFQERSELDLLLSYTDFVDDEKPLRIAVDDRGGVTALGEAADRSPSVTAGLYGVGPAAFSLLGPALERGLKRLRNFLGFVLQTGLSVAGYRLSKAVDVDRVCDVEAAEAFLLEHGVR
jgi:NDP-sugar pyrophosphorylase family protein